MKRLNDPSNFFFPEYRNDTPLGDFIASRKDLGIAMCGGGMRAASSTLGWYDFHNVLFQINFETLFN